MIRGETYLLRHDRAHQLADSCAKNAGKLLHEAAVVETRLTQSRKESDSLNASIISQTKNLSASEAVDDENIELSTSQPLSVMTNKIVFLMKSSTASQKSLSAKPDLSAASAVSALSIQSDQLAVMLRLLLNTANTGVDDSVMQASTDALISQLTSLREKLRNEGG